MAPNPTAVLASVIADASALTPAEPLHEHLRPGESIVYRGRLAPVDAPGARGDVATGILAAALAELPDRRSRIARGAR